MKQSITYFILLISLQLVFCGCVTHTKGPAIDTNLPEKHALLVIDLQVDCLDASGRMPVDSAQAGVMIKNVNKLIVDFHKRQRDVIYIVTEYSETDYVANWFRNYAGIKGTPGAAMSKKIRIVSDHRFVKEQSDAFSNAKLDHFLRSKKITHLTLTGVFSDRCVLATARAALQRGYRVITVSDAIAARNVDAKQAALKKHRRSGAEIKPAVGVIKWLESPGEEK